MKTAKENGASSSTTTTTTTPSMRLVVGAIVVAVLGVLLMMQQQQSTTARTKLQHWHQGPEWERLFKVYDEIAAELFGQEDDCASRRIKSKNGKWSTQIHTCGDDANPPVFFFHGVATCSLMWGDWLIPTLKQHYYTIAVDYPCDAGRSGPTTGDAANDCPQDVGAIIEWFHDLKQQVMGQKDNSSSAINKKVSLVGYSYGSFISSQIAIEMPDAIDKVVLIAPAAVFAPVKATFMARAAVFGLVNSLLPFQPIQDIMSKWFFGYMMASVGDDDEPMKYDDQQLELRAASDNVGPLQLPVYPVPVEVSTLREMNQATPVLLVIGDEEVVMDGALAVKTAAKAGIATKLYKKAGHLLCGEHPRQPSIGLVKSFLDTGTYTDTEE